MKPFLFSKGQKHYARFFVPTELREHFGKKYLVFALGAGAGHEIRLKAHQLEHDLTNHCNSLLQNDGMKNSRRGRKLTTQEFDVSFDDDGIHFSDIDSDEDLERAKELLAFANSLPKKPRVLSPEEKKHQEKLRALADALAEQTAPKPKREKEKGLKLMGLVDKYFLLKSHLLPATAQAYKNCCQEFQDFLKNPNITSIMASDVSRFQEYLARKNNSVRTIENKIGLLSSLFNFAIKQSHYFGDNPAEGRALLTKKQRIARGYETFELEEIKQIFTAEEFTRERERDPDFYYLCILGLVTGCRVGELSSLKKSDFKKTPSGTGYITIRVAKTLAGIRSVPFHVGVLGLGLQEFIDSKNDNVFKYTDREGKGAGNASGKKFTRLLETLKLKREKLVFHSLRKFFNDYLLKNDVPYEPRCQYVGHEIDDTNVKSYTKQFSEDELLRYVEKSQEDILIACNFIKT
mgnify:CR=1 FL=1